MENAAIVELVPDRRLLDPNFAGYTLCFVPIPLYINNLESKVDHVLRSEEQYSLQHVKIFGLHNHLFCDPWSLTDVYFVDEKWMVQRNVNNQDTGRLSGLAQVWEIPSNHVRRPGHYNPSIGFPGLDFVLLSDGAGTLHLVKSGDRQKARNSATLSSNWQVLLSEEVCGTEVPFVVVHSAVEESKIESADAVEGRKVHCLLMHVEEAKEVKGQREIPSNEGIGQNRSHASAFVTVIEWVTLLEGKDGSWSVSRIRKLCGSAIPYYASVEADGTGVVISSEKPFIFIDDTEKPLSKEETKIVDTTNENNDIDWQQDDEEVRLTIPLASGQESVTLNEVSVSIEGGKTLCIKKSEQIMLQGVTLHLLDHDLTTWELKDNVLHVCFHKQEEGKIWSKLFSEGGPKSCEEVDPKMQIHNQEIHERLAQLTSETLDPPVSSVPFFNSEELEECDEVPSNASSLCRFDGEEHVVTHKACISSNQWLFNMQMHPDLPPTICLRHGPDGLLWQPMKSDRPMPASEKRNWKCSHVASLVSIGYVQASKPRKFIACATDASYVAICEANRYIYIYRQPELFAGNGQLRNRRTGEQINKVARQQVICLPISQEILGVHATVSTLYLLMEDKLLACSMNQ